ncbi:MAG: hypothetical protein ABI587_13135 [Gemmatimonadales bacterium]
MPIHPVDSLVDNTLLGDRITPVIQFIFQQAPWIMWGGAILAAVVAFFLVRWCWPRRRAAFGWLRSRSSGVKLVLVGLATTAVLVAAGLGFKSYEFVETDRRFCNGCHIFVASGQAWVESDTGNYTLVNRMEGKHDSLSCHSCHPLKPVKEAVKMLFWMSGVRDKEIPAHAKVPRAVCEQCHVTGEAKESWQAIAATAGHRTHLESDSSALKGKVECLTCHAQTAHRFVPVSQTCGQSGCHEESTTHIVLGKMATQGEFHCVACHNFTAEVPLLATRDSAAGTLRPALRQCFSCHEMKKRLPDFDAARDPHNGSCGTCHNPHVQKTPAEARKSCTTAGCHADWRKEPFHTGVQHRNVAETCVTCHSPHAARVDASDCTGCHNAVRARPNGPRLNPPAPFDTLKALQSMAPPPPARERPNKVKGDAPPDPDPPPPISLLPRQPSDTFSHDRHQRLACLTCHASATGHGGLTFEAPRGCQICHHQAPQRSRCAECHTGLDLATTLEVSVSVTIPQHAPRARPVAFSHERHDTLACTACHTTAVSLAPSDSTVTCQGCHDSHHQAGRDCATCHRTDAITPAHARPVVAHTRCDACHTPARIVALSPTRSFCLTCHTPEVDHHAPAECTTCHFLRAPVELESVLHGTGVTP